MVPRQEALRSTIQRAARRNEYVAEAVWWTAFACYAATVAAISFVGVVGGVYGYFRYVYPAVAGIVGPMAQAVVGLAYVFVLFVVLHTAVSRFRSWLYGGGTVAGWKR